MKASLTQDPEFLKFFEGPISQFADRIARWLLEDKENVKALLEIIDETLVSQLDFTQLVQVNRTFIPDNLREQESDLIYQLPFQEGARSETVLIYILIEHQSTVDLSMGFRMLFYMTQIWDAQRREWDRSEVPKGEWRLKPVLPIVFYTGDRRWETPITLKPLMEVPESLSRFVPSFETLFLGVKGASAAALTATGHSFGWLLRVLQKEYASQAELSEALVEALEHLESLAGEAPAMWRRSVFYLYLLILHRRPMEEHSMLKDLVLGQIRDSSRREEGEEMAQSMAEYLFHQGEALGRKEGEALGKTLAKQEAILKLVHARFHNIPESVTQLVRGIQNLSTLDGLFENVATASTFEDIPWHHYSNPHAG